MSIKIVSMSFIVANFCELHSENSFCNHSILFFFTARLITIPDWILALPKSYLPVAEKVRGIWAVALSVSFLWCR